MMPMKETRGKVSGTAKTCGHKAAEGVVAREAKSGALLGVGFVSGVSEDVDGQRAKV